MKVVIIGSAHPFRGGLAAYNERLAREYIRQGHEVVIYTFTLQYPNFLFPGKTQYSDAPKPTDLDIRIRINSINPLNWLSVGKEIRKMQPDLVIVKYWLPFMGPCFGTICRQIKKNGHSKIISIIDNIIPHEKRLGDGMFTRYFVKPIDGFVAMSKAVLNDIDFFDKSKKRLYCPHPLYDNFGKAISREEALKRLNLDDSFRYLLFFGFIRDYKGLDILLKAMADKRFDAKLVRLIVAGEYYTDPKPYQELLNKLNLHQRVIMATDFIPDDKVTLYFSACDMVVQPYKNATQSGVTQIAYHFEKPMLVTDVGGLSEMVPNGVVGYVVKPDPQEIADKILHFYETNSYETFVNGVKKEKQKYLWERMTESIEELMKS